MTNETTSRHHDESPTKEPRKKRRKVEGRGEETELDLPPSSSVCHGSFAAFVHVTSKCSLLFLLDFKDPFIVRVVRD